MKYFPPWLLFSIQTIQKNTEKLLENNNCVNHGHGFVTTYKFIDRHICKEIKKIVYVINELIAIMRLFSQIKETHEKIRQW